MLYDIRGHVPHDGKGRGERPGRHPLYQRLTTKPDADGQSGDVQWNFEKFLVSPEGEIVARFRPKVLPDADEVVSALESVLPA